MKQTLRQLTISLVALLLCFSMLLGTTYAWFTDSVTSSNNIIKAGNLDLKVFWTEDIATPDWKDAEDSSKGAIFDYDKWEPGYTSVRYIKIVNDGNLAFKYLLSIIPNGTLGILADVIDVYYVENASQKITSVSDMTAAGTLCEVITNNTNNQGVLLPVGTADADNVNGDYVGELVIAIALKMRESAGNEYQNQSVGSSFSIQVLATQYTFEGDSFDNIYDRPSQWPGNITVGDNSITTDVAVSNNLTTAEYSETTDDGNIVVNYPVGIGVNDGTDTLTLTVRDKSKSDSNITLDENEASLALDVHVDGVSEDNVVPIEVVLKNRVPAGLNMGNYRLYHVEDGQTVAMTYLEDSDPAQHNGFRYDPATGDLTLYLKSFSEVNVVANTVNAWNGDIVKAFAGGTGTETDPYLIANADQLAYFNYVVSNDNGNYGDKHYKLLADINLGGEENANNGTIFYPIGYYKAINDGIATIALNDIDAPEFVYFEEDPDYARGNVATLADEGENVWYTYGGAFKGTFDGNGNTISNIYQNTWQMKGDYDGHYWNDAMGIFGYVYGGTIKNLTVDNFTSDGEFTPTGVIAAYAANATFENIAITNCNPRVYNTGNGGIVGVGGNSSDTADKELTFINITVDNSNKISALWGSWDVACGGIMGMFRGNGLVHFENCHIGAQIDVYNDVCGNYQYYWYRYSGMVIGSIRGKNINVDGYTVPDTTGITANNCTVHFGDWNDYYYCELVANTIASYTHDHQFSRLTEIASIDEIKNGDAWTKTGNFLLDGECYHIVNKNGTLTRHSHEDAGYETVNGETVLKEDKQVVYLPFNQLIQGDGWGVKTIGFRNDSELDFDGITILDREEANSIKKFDVLVNGTNYEEGTVLTIGEIFAALNGVSINVNTLMVFVSPVGEGSTASAIYTPNTSDWTKGTLTFSGSGAAKIVITDYTYCREAVASVTVAKHEHKYDNPCDTTCSECGNTREVTHNYEEAVTAPTCTEEGYTTYTCACGDSYVADKVTATGHKYNVVVTAPTCTADGYTTYTCEICNHTYTANEVAAKGHSYNAVVTAPTCTAEGYTTYTCTCGDSYVADKVAAKGHSYNEVVTAPTCTANGYTTYTCTCGDTYTANETEALGHIVKKFTSDDFIYRVGNKNAVELSSLFNVGKRTVTVSGSNVSGNASVTVNGTSLTFSGTGVVKVTLTTSDCTCDKCETELELDLEVVDATNVTGAANATANNVVLLNDCGFSSLEVSNGYTLYGNGFTMTCGSDSPALDMGYAFVTLNNGTLDNVQIVCPNFDYAVLYKSNMTESGNRSQTTDRTRYYNVKSGVMVSGNSQILNSRISGARAAVNVAGGNCLIDNSRIELGAVASLLVGSANSVTLRDVTLVQKPTASTCDSSKVLMGFSVLFICDADGNTAPVTLEGTLVQNAWVNESDKQYVPSAGQSIISTVLAKTDYLHDIDGDGKNESLNLGFAYMPESVTSKVNATTITDNRTNKNDVPYDYADVSILNGKTYVYSYKNTNGTEDSFKTESEYKPNKQGDIITVTYSDTTDGLESGKSFGTDGWVYELNVDLDKASGYKLDFSKLSMNVNGVSVTDYKVNGSAKPDSVAVTAGGVTYTLTATIDGKEYTANYKVTGTETSKASPSLVAANYEAGLCVASSYGGTWHGAAPALEGIQIKYWSVAEKQYKTINLADYTPTTKGQQNGTNSTWTYSPDNGDFTLTLTGGQVHSSNNVYAMPVVCDGKLYFVASKSNGLVNSGNSARTIPVSYTFKDNNNGDVLTFSHTWSVAENKDAQYKYSDFCSGTLTKLESSSGGGNSCLAEGTLITLADGSKKAIENLRKGDSVMAFDHISGTVTANDVIIVVKTESSYYKNTFVFSDGTELVTINEHGVYDLDMNKYVNIDHINYKQFIGHRFVSIDVNGNVGVKTLVDVISVFETGYKYDIVSDQTLNYVAEDTLSVTHVLVDVINSFDFDENMKYDVEKMRTDIDRYGLYTYDEWEAYCDISVFEEYNIPVMKVGISKGMYTKDYIIGLINTFVLDESVQIID